MRGFKKFLVPVVVGTGSLFLLEDAIEKVSNDKLRKRFLSKEFKILILFSAAYAANGTKIIPAIISLYLYHLITIEVLDIKLEEEKEEEEEEEEEKKEDLPFCEET